MECHRDIGGKIVADYQRMYGELFHAITETIEALDRFVARYGDTGGELAWVIAKLERSQIAAEEIYLKTDDGTNDHL